MRRWIPKCAAFFLRLRELCAFVFNLLRGRFGEEALVFELSRKEVDILLDGFPFFFKAQKLLFRIHQLAERHKDARRRGDRRYRSLRGHRLFRNGNCPRARKPFEERPAAFKKGGIRRFDVHGNLFGGRYVQLAALCADGADRVDNFGK